MIVKDNWIHFFVKVLYTIVICIGCIRFSVNIFGYGMIWVICSVERLIWNAIW